MKYCYKFARQWVFEYFMYIQYTTHWLLFIAKTFIVLLDIRTNKNMDKESDVISSVLNDDACCIYSFHLSCYL